MAATRIGPDMETLVETQGNDVYKVCYVYLGRYGLADDAFQDTFLKAIEKWDTYRGDSDVRAWILQIARNTCRDLLRSSWFRTRAEYRDEIGGDEGDSGPWDPEDLQAGLEFRESESRLLDKVLHLPLRYREVLLLKAWFEMETPEIARLLHITESTVRSRLKRARAKLGRPHGGEWNYET